MRGDLSETTAAGACRSLATREASGALLIDAAEGTGLIRFREGRIVGVAAPTPGARVGDRLVGAGILDRSALDEVLQDQRDGGETRPLPRALVERGLVPGEAVERILTDRMLDALLALTQLHTGTLLFLTEEELHADGPRDDVEVEGPTLEVDDAFRAVAERQEELEEIRLRVPDAATVPTPTSLAEDALRGEGVDADATTILTHIDGHRSIEEVAVTVGYGLLEVTRLVEGLASAGLVELEHPRDAAGDELDDAIRQLSGHTAGPDPAMPRPTDGAGGTRPSAAPTDGPMIEVELPRAPGEPATPGPHPRSVQEPPTAGTTGDRRDAAEAEHTREARETGVSWDDLFGGGPSSEAPARGSGDAPAAASADRATDRAAETDARPATRPTAPTDDAVPTASGPERSAAPHPEQDAADTTREGTAPGEEAPGGAGEPGHSPVDPPPFFADTRRPDAPGSGSSDEPTAPERRQDRRSTDEDTDVSEFLRELSRLALGEDAPPTPRRSGAETPGPADTPRPAASHDEDRARRTQGSADTEHARRRRGFFGRG